MPVIGKGGFGSVYKYTLAYDGQRYQLALKEEMKVCYLNLQVHWFYCFWF